MLSLVCIKSGAPLVPLGQIRPHSYSLSCTAVHCISVLERLSSWEAVGLDVLLVDLLLFGLNLVILNVGGQLICLYAVEIVRYLEEITTPHPPTKENITWNLYVFV